MNAIGSTIEQFLLNQPWLLPFVIFIVALVESFAVVGVIVPGVVMLFGLAFLASELGMPLWLILAAAATGAITGDTISYWLGRHWQDRIWHTRWLSGHQQGLKRAHYFLNHSGALSIIVGRFIGPLRPLMPMIAGALGMRLRLFLSLDILSAFAWAPAYILPGWLAAKSLEFSMAALSSLAPWQLHGLMLVVALLAMGIWLVMDLWAHERNHWRSSTRHLSAAALCLTVGTLLIWQKPWTLDLLIFNSRPITGYWPDVWVHLDMLGQPELLLILLAVTTLLLLMQGQSALALTITFTAVVAIGITTWLPAIIGIGRPGALHYEMGSFATPASTSFGLAMAVIWLTGLADHSSRQLTLRNNLAAWLSLIVLAPTGAYLGVHWFSDTLAGALLGAGLSHLGLFVCRRWHLVDDIDWRPVAVLMLLSVYAHQLVFAMAYKYYYASLILTH